MTKNPLLNAGAALLYISIVASAMFYLPKFAGPVDTVIMPVAFLSLFVFSAASMAYIFCFMPITLYLDGSKKEAVDLFIKSILFFGGITFCVFACMILIGAKGNF